ncbi:hypothetical protein [Natrinema halophilum]|uniref:Uncharacterized protein n=1 Tax=Natrinema halophilum TaxID=1699371 RepID=A0A7D5H5V1_9EURY|nr:hypothetical protein [Natrinema halophilum]QLG48275.1 hypothetical protein HYG82_05135 [Natrinema halophilum]
MGMVVLHAVSMTNVFGIPIGALVLILTVSDTTVVSIPSFLTPVILFNVAIWAYYGWRSSHAAWEGVPFSSGWDRLRYSVLCNPITQALYATLWVVPIRLAVLDATGVVELTNDPPQDRYV